MLFLTRRWQRCLRPCETESLYLSAAKGADVSLLTPLAWMMNVLFFGFASHDERDGIPPPDSTGPGWAK